jgi:LPXTG-site transpeptidase (sortase) family protein
MRKWILFVWIIIVITGSASCTRSTEQKSDHSEQKNDHLSKLTKTEMIRSDTKKIDKMIKVREVANKGIVPVKLYIPAVHIQAIVEPVYVSDKGQMGVPRSTERVGYLSSGVLPGAIGNAIMDGHVDNYKGPAVFFQLKQLKKGDAVIVKNDTGCKIQFVVDSVEIYKTSNAPLSKIFGSAEESRLNLITCTGRYSRKRKEHEARLVVYTKRLTNKDGCKQTHNKSNTKADH